MPWEERAGVGHHVVLSIVAVDRVGFGYYQGKLAQEQVVLAGPVPATVLRATQFYELAAQVLQRTRLGPVALVPRMRVQPVAARDAAAALVDVVAGPPLGRAPDLAGPQVHEMPDMARRVVRARGGRIPPLPLPFPGSVGRAMATGALLPGPDARTAPTTFDEWLASEDAPRS